LGVGIVEATADIVVHRRVAVGGCGLGCGARAGDSAAWSGVESRVVPVLVVDS
jgi:hypothetical protein